MLVERRPKTAKTVGEVGYFSFLSLNVEFREEYGLSDFCSVRQG